MCQLVTDIINLFLIDRGLDNYVNRFTIRMQAPVTQEEIDRRTNTDNRIRYISDVMGQLSDIEDKAIRLKIYKALLGNTINDPQVITYLQEYIDKIEAEKSDKNSSETSSEESDEKLPSLEDIKPDTNKQSLSEADKNEDTDSYLPSPEELGL